MVFSRCPLVLPARGVRGGAVPSAVAVVLHGGRADGLSRSRPWHLSYLRALFLARALHRRLPYGVEVVLVRYRVRGWNDSMMSPVQDARVVLDELVVSRPGVPVVLVGHSMGGRAALHLLQHPGVVGAVLLSPWVVGDEVDLSGSTVSVVHGTADRWTSPGASSSLVEAASRAGVDAVLTLLPGAGHFMLRDQGRWAALTTWGVQRALRGRYAPLGAAKLL